ncbi:MAG TPA: hypothetical protein GXX36_06595 [Clostridiaceae bacterium]|nr:hypothetical protein [Clostridiaceae bacterium]
MIFLIMIYIVIFLLNVPGLINRKEWRELTVFLVLYIIAFIMGLMYTLDVPIPSPMEGLQYLIAEVLGIKYPKN